MVIVLVHWRIKPDKVEDFFAWWSKDADIENRASLTGEFLSRPFSLPELESITPPKHPFRVCDLKPSSCDEPYVSFVNVGLWKSWRDFYEEVGHDFNDQKKKMHFEQCRRTRTILKPKRRRIGEWPLPEGDKSK